MFEIYKVSTSAIILSGLTFQQAFKLRMMWADRWDLEIRQSKTAE